MKKLPEMAPNGARRIFVPTNLGLADILDGTDLDFESFHFLELFDRKFLHFQVPKFPDFQTPPLPAHELSDPNLTPSSETCVVFWMNLLAVFPRSTITGQ